MKKIDNVVASAVDDNYLWPLLVMLKSAKSTSSFPFRFILGFDENTLSDNNLRLIETVCKIWSIEMTSIRINLNIDIDQDSYITSATYARLLLADILPDNFLWIDADVLCQNGWDGIFEIGRNSAENVMIIAVKDPLVQFGIPDTQLENSAVRVAGTNYFNAGVVFLKPKRWRLHNATEKWRWAFENSLKLGFQFHDQCILNYVLSESSQLIPNEFNYLVRNESERLIKHPRAIHFAGGFKPWHMPEIALWVVAPKLHRDLYRKYALNQAQVIISICFSKPLLAMHLWNERLRLRQTDTFRRIIRQKKQWWVKSEKIRIYKIIRKIWSLITKLPAIGFLWNRHLQGIIKQRDLVIAGILQNHENEIAGILQNHENEIAGISQNHENEIAGILQNHENEIAGISQNHENEMQNIINQLQNKGPAGIQDLGEVSFGTFEIFYSEPPTDLAALFDKYGSDKGTLGNPAVKFSWRSHNYSDYYSELFHRSRKSIRKVFECGIGTNNETIESNMTSSAIPGASLRAWRDYFPNAIIYGADVDAEILFVEDRIETGYIDQLDSKSIKKYFSTFPKNSLDIMIDDGLHTFEAATNLLENSIEFLGNSGTYVIEDVHYSDVIKFKNYLSLNKYQFRIVIIKRKAHVIGDNILIVINR